MEGEIADELQAGFVFLIMFDGLRREEESGECDPTRSDSKIQSSAGIASGPVCVYGGD